jgi:peptide/nickel transport system substrate-binding protein
MIAMNRLVCSMLVCVLLLAACGGTPDAADDAAPTPAPSDSVSSERGTLRTTHEVIWGGIDSLDPASSVVFYISIRMLYDTLVRPDENHQPAPSLATSWEASDDATTWTFTLRDDVAFHDGTPLTAADVAYTIERVLAPDSLSPVSSVLQRISRLVRKTLSFSKKRENHIGAIWYFVHHYNASLA